MLDSDHEVHCTLARSRKRAHTHSLSHTHSLTHTHTLSLSLTHTHTHTHTHTCIVSSIAMVCSLFPVGNCQKISPALELKVARN